MKRSQQQEQKQGMKMKYGLRAVIIVSILGSLAACTKQRDATFPDGQGSDIFAISEVNGVQGTLYTGSQSAVRSDEDRYRAAADVGLNKISKADVPERLNDAFKDLYLSAPSNAAQPMTMKLDAKFLTVFKTVDPTAQLSPMEEALAHGELVGAQAKKLVPLFQLQVVAFGKIVRVKNDLKEDTTSLRLDPSDWKSATHVQLKILPSDRQEVKPNDVDQKELYLASKLDGQVLSKAEIRQQLGVKVDLAADASLAMTRLDGSNLAIYEVASLASLPEDQRKLIRTGADANNSEVIKCSDAKLSADGQARLQAMPNPSDCVLVKHFALQVAFVTPQRSIGLDGIESNTLEFKETGSSQGALIRITTNERPDRVTLAGDGLRPSSDSAVPVASVKGKEFFMRRTLQDSPNTFSYTFAGSSGNLDIAKFNFTPNTVEVVRSRPIVNSSGTTSSDNDRLMIFPAMYYKLITKDSQGNVLAAPRPVQTNYDDPDAIADIDWARNQVASVNSAIEYYSLEQCFQGTNSVMVLDVDNRVDSGVLNFSWEKTYQASSSQDCAGIYQAGYTDAVQTTFTFRERISLLQVPAGASEDPMVALPFDAQKKLGFGLFTSTKKVPDALGNSGTTKTDVPMGWIYDVRAGKKIQYVLAGLPTDSPNAELRHRMIVATKEVIADWNVAFHRAFKGTPMDRDGDIVELAIEGSQPEEGLTNVPTLQLGDLERNYIYYVKKLTESRVIGLGGAHANPRSGQVVAASVFIYGGNIVADVDSMRKSAQADKDFSQQWQAVLTPEATAAGAPNDGTAVSGGPGAAPAAGGSADPATAAAGGATSSVLGAIGKSGLPVLHGSFKVPSRMQPATLQKGALALKHVADLGKRPTKMVSAAQIEAMKSSLSPQDRALMAAVETAKRAGKLGRPREFDSIYLDSLYDEMSKSGALSSDKLGKLANTRARQKAVTDLLSKMRAANICVFEAQDAVGPVKPKDTDSDLDIAVKVYKATLAHELGHNFGLRHNFEGSYDKDNYLFPEEATGLKALTDQLAALDQQVQALPLNEQANPQNSVVQQFVAKSAEVDQYKATHALRDYTSVMDYLVDDYYSYSGLGPQDVAAIRAAYTGYIELDPAVAVADGAQPTVTSSSGIQIPVLKDTRLVSIADYARAIGVSDWTNDLSAASISKLPIKAYRFCTDEDESQFPTCRMFDFGGTPTDIVNYEIQQYHAMYSLTNLPGDRLNFEWYQNGSYIGRLFSRMTATRQFLEETFYRYILGLDQVGDHLDGARKALEFLDEVIRTPDAPVSASGIERWTTYEQTFPGVGTLQANVQRKQISDEKLDDLFDRLKVRGIEYDKVVALIMLTERNMGFARYEQMGLRLNFPFFDQLVDGLIADQNHKPKTPTDQLTSMKLLKEAMSESIQPAARMNLPEFGSPVLPLDGSFATSSTQLMRMYGVLGSIQNLDVDGFELKDNFSTLFRVEGGKNPPTGLTAISEIGAGPGSHKLWAADQATVSSSMVNTVALMDQVTGFATDAADQLKAWQAARVALATALTAVHQLPTADQSNPQNPTVADAIAKQQAMLAAEAAIDAKIAALPVEAGMSHNDAQGNPVAVKTATYRSIIQQLEAQAPQLGHQQAVLAQAQPANPAEAADLAQKKAAISEAIISIHNQLTSLAQQSPLVDTMLSAGTIIPAGEDAESQAAAGVLQQILPTGTVSNVRSTAFGSLQTLNLIYFGMHPELNQ